MEFVLKRDKQIGNAITGILECHSVGFECVTLERLFDKGQGLVTKVPKGVYLCVRGTHRLASSPKSFETFQVMNVPGHTGILFHTGNVFRDSEGCILLGLEKGMTEGGDLMIMKSRSAFELFMAQLSGHNHFNLTIV